MTDKRETYTAKECAQRLGMNPNSLRNLIRTKQVPFGIAYRQPSGRMHLIIPKAAFEKFMAEGGSREEVIP